MCSLCKPNTMPRNPDGSIVNPALPSKFTWRPVRAADTLPWIYWATCKVCNWDKISDYDNLLEWVQLHQCERKRK